MLALPLVACPGKAQTVEPLRPGEAFLTRFSGTRLEEQGDRRTTVIDVDGTVGSIIDLRSPEEPPRGEYWGDVPQRGTVTAADVGQVFGIAIDDGSPASVYLTATSAFGLHRNANNTDWMSGMWGEGGGPGTVYRLSAENGYAPEVFAEITLDGRANSGPALGNIAFDPWNRQLFVSDLETGMIHRLALSNGADLGHYDQGIDGRASFIDAVTGEPASLPLVAFNADGQAQIADCPAGKFASHPECWNYSDFRRRVWGLAVRRDPGNAEVRLYYSVWSSQGFGNPAYGAAGPEEKRNSLWSVRIDEAGGFDVSDVRREFFLPDFFVEDADIARAGASQPVADIAFPKDPEQNFMLLAERGGVRNLGLEARAPFAYPNEARVLRYQINDAGVWQSAGRYDVGFYDRVRLGPPYVRANAAGGVDIGPGYGEDGQVDESLLSAFVWMTGDALCSPEGPCFDRKSGQRDDRSEVSGLQGLPGDIVDAVAPAEALMPYPAEGAPYPPRGPSSAVAIDADGELAHNDATKIGDVEIYQPYLPEALAAAEVPLDWGVPSYAADEPWWPESAAGQSTPGLDLAVQKAIPALCQAGAPCDFVMVVTNTGTLPFTAPITIVDELANGWTLAGWGPAGSQWNCQQFGTRLACTHPTSSLMPGEAGALMIALRVPAAQVSGQWQNCAILDFGPGGGDANPSNDEGCASLQFGPAAGGGGFAGGPPDQRDLAIEKFANNAACAAGAPCSFSVGISNAGQVKFDGAIRFVDTMPTGWSFANASQGWWCLLTAGGGPLFSCWRDIVLDPGQSQNLTVTLTPPAAGQTGQAENCAEIDWSQNEKDPNPANDRACATVNAAPGSAGAPPGQPTGFGIVQGPQGVGYELAIEKGPPHAAQAAAAGAGALHVCAPLQPCPFTLTVTNMGVERFEGPFRFTDTPKGGWSYAGVSPGWTCGPGAGGSFTCAGGLSLDPGQSAAVDLELNPMPGVPLEPLQGENCVEIDWSQGKKDGNSDNDRSCTPVILAVGAPSVPGAEVTVEVEGPDLNVRKDAVASTCAPGEECWFNIVINGTQDFPFAGKFEVSDIPPEGWTFAGGGNLGLWNCETFPFTHCKYDVSKYPGLPAGGFTTSDFLGTDIHFTVPQDAKEGTYKNCILVSFPPPATGEIGKSTKTACAFVQVSNKPKLTIAKHFGEAVCVAGGECNFIITVKNEGKGPYNGLFYIYDYETHLLHQLIIDSVSAVSPQGHQWNCKIAGVSLPGIAAQTIHHFICYADLISPGEVVIITVRATMRDIPSVDVLENCSKLFLNASDPNKLSQTDKTDLVRWALESEGYSMKSDGPLTAAEKTAISEYKKKYALSETSGDITDELVKEFLPEVEDASGAKEIVSCAKLPIGRPGLIISKMGLPAADFRVPNVRVGTPEAETCALNHVCPFTITVTGNSDAPYTDPIVIEDSSPNGWWGLVSYEGAGWSCTGTDKFVCTHPPANLTKSKSLQLTLAMRPGTTFYQATAGQKHPWIYNCARVRYKSASQYQLQKRGEYESCYRLRLMGSDMSDWDYVAAGTGSCTPPNCSSYEFTATLKTSQHQRPVSLSAALDYDASGTGNCSPPDCAAVSSAAAAETLGYEGSLSMRITPPPGSSFPGARITKSPPSCPASAWSCTKSGAEFGGAFACRIDDCVLAPDEQVTVRIDGNVAADLTEPPEVEQTREVCGQLEYQPMGQSGGIEQKVGVETKNACVTTTILPKPKVVDLQVSTAPQGQCSAGKTCQAELSLGNVGADEFTDAVELEGQVSPPVELSAVTPLPAGWTCRMLEGGRYSCGRDPSEFAPGAVARLTLALNIPSNFAERQITHAVRIAWPPGKGDPNSANDSALFTIPVTEFGRVHAYDLALTKTATGSCKPGGPCRFRLRILNQGEEAFEGPISIVDSFSRRGVSLQGTADGLSCQSTGTTLNCLAPKQVLQPGAQAIFLIDTLLPRVIRNTSLRNCAEITAPGAINVDRPSRVDIRSLQLALNEAGYEAGPADGVIGSRTRRAIAAARTSFGLSAGDRIDSELVLALFGGAAGRDTNRSNDSDCVTVELPVPPRPTPPPPPSAPVPAPVVPAPIPIPVIPPAPAPVTPAPVPVIPPAPVPVTPPTPPCPDGQVRVRGLCMCPSDRPVWTGSQCIPKLQVIPTPICPPGQFWNEPTKECLDVIR